MALSYERRFSAVFGALLRAALVGCFAIPLTNAAAADRPNILVIMSDDHTKRAISAYGMDLTETPNIDRIAKEGVVFQNAFVTNSICSPSRAVMLTGKFSHFNGVRDNGQPFDGSQQTFHKTLRAAGYQTSVIGKWHLKSEPVGFDDWQVLIDQGEYYSPRFLSADGVEQYDGAYVTDKITDIAIATLDARDTSKPFVMLYHHKAPHRNWMPRADDLPSAAERQLPLPPDFFDDFEGRPAAKEADMLIADMFLSYDMKMQPGEYEAETGSGGAHHLPDPGAIGEGAWMQDYARLTPDQKAKWDAYYSAINAEYQTVKHDPEARAGWMYQRYLNDYLATVKALDENVGRMLDYLDSNGLSDNTVVIYTSDQGFYLGEHGWYDKRFMYEQSMSTPLLLRYPNAVAAGQEVDQLVQNLDLAPTILDFAGVPKPDDMQGYSLARLVAPEVSAKPQGPWRTGLFYHYYGTPGGWHNVPEHYGIRTHRYKLIHFKGGHDHWEMYDLETDPRELQNLYGTPEHAALQARLHEELEALRVHYGDPHAGH